MLSLSCRLALAALILLATACSDRSAPTQEDLTPAASKLQAEEASSVSSQEAWWSQLSSLCGNAYTGRLSSKDPIDKSFAEKTMTMFVRPCEENRLEIPFHVDTNRSRTWILTRTADGIQLQHDHRHEDGSQDTVTLYGGHTQTPGTETTQDFPADAYSKELFEANQLEASVVNVWSMEILPGQRFSYILRRPARHFQVDFDLTQTVEQPPAAWGHEKTPPNTP